MFLRLTLFLQLVATRQNFWGKFCRAKYCNICQDYTIRKTQWIQSCAVLLHNKPCCERWVSRSPGFLPSTSIQCEVTDQDEESVEPELLTMTNAITKEIKSSLLHTCNSNDVCDVVSKINQITRQKCHPTFIDQYKWHILVLAVCCVSAICAVLLILYRKYWIKLVAAGKCGQVHACHDNPSNLQLLASPLIQAGQRDIHASTFSLGNAVLAVSLVSNSRRSSVLSSCSRNMLDNNSKLDYITTYISDDDVFVQPPNQQFT